MSEHRALVASREALPAGRTVGDLRTGELVAVGPGEGLAPLHQLMLDQWVRPIPVVDGEPTGSAWSPTGTCCATGWSSRSSRRPWWRRRCSRSAPSER